MRTHSNSQLILRSSIQPMLLRYFVFRGSCLAGLGAIIAFFSGAFLPVIFLKTWGFLIFSGAFALITWGLLPYRRIKALENNPNRLVINQDEKLLFIKKGKLVFNLPIKDIIQLRYVVFKHTYGIAISIDPKSSQVLLLPKHQLDLGFGVGLGLGLDKNLYDAKFLGDYFLPYFSKHSYEELREFIFDEDGVA